MYTLKPYIKLKTINNKNLSEIKIINLIAWNVRFRLVEGGYMYQLACNKQMTYSGPTLFHSVKIMSPKDNNKSVEIKDFRINTSNFNIFPKYRMGFYYIVTGEVFKYVMICCARTDFLFVDKETKLLTYYKYD